MALGKALNYYTGLSISIISLACIGVFSQNVLTRILPSDRLILESSRYSDTRGSSPHGSAIIWCLVQDLEQDHDSVLSIELFFKSAPQVRTSLDLDREGIFEGSFSQFGLPAREQKDRYEWTKDSLETGSSSNLNNKSGTGQVTNTEDKDDFPDAQFTGLGAGSNQIPIALSKATGSASVTERATTALDPSDLPDNANRLDNPKLAPGSILVAKVIASASGKLDVRHMQRSGVSVRGVISSSNPNLSSLQVSMRRAKCSDCGTYVCVLRYRNSSGSVGESYSSSDFIVAQSTIHRLNIGIRRWELSENHNYSLVSFVDLFCFGTISNPVTQIIWKRQVINETNNILNDGNQPTASRQGVPRLGQNCQYWRASHLRHSWQEYDETWLLGCTLSRDPRLLASMLLSRSGQQVMAICGDPNSTLPISADDKVKVVCDIKTLHNVTSVSWQRKGFKVGSCSVTTEHPSNILTWSCFSSNPRYSIKKAGRKFVLHIARFSNTEDKGQWSCLIIPLVSAMAASCVLG